MQHWNVGSHRVILSFADIPTYHTWYVLKHLRRPRADKIEPKNLRYGEVALAMIFNKGLKESPDENSSTTLFG